MNIQSAEARHTGLYSCEVMTGVLIESKVDVAGDQQIFSFKVTNLLKAWQLKNNVHHFMNKLMAFSWCLTKCTHI